MRIHPNEESLGRLVARVGTGRGRKVLGHLLSCDRCRDRLGDMLDWSGDVAGGELPWSPKDYTAMLDRLVEKSAEMGTPIDREQVEAPMLLAELLLHPAKRRRLLLRNSRRFRSWSLAELLLDRSREEAFEDPAQAESLARLGLEVIGQLGASGHPAPLVADLEGRGYAYLANTLRLRSDLKAAEEQMDRAMATLERGTADPFEAARVLDLKASLRRDQRQFEDAFSLLERAVSLYRSIGEAYRASRSEVKLGLVKRDAGVLQEAILLLEKALGSLSTENDPRLVLCARHNLILCATDLERFMEARKVFRDTEELYDRFPDPWTQRRRAWLEGRIFHGLGQLEAAETSLVAAQRGFVEQEIAYDAALVSLDLAAVYAEQGRTAELRRLSSEMLPVFRAQDIHREALAALSYFRWAAEMEQATGEVVQGVLDYLHRARHDPGLKFVAPPGQ